MRYFFILAYLPSQDYDLRVVMTEGDNRVVRFAKYGLALKWCVEFLAPDWEWVILPMRTTKIHNAEWTDEFNFHPFKVGGTD